MFYTVADVLALAFTTRLCSKHARYPTQTAKNTHAPTAMPITAPRENCPPINIKTK